MSKKRYQNPNHGSDLFLNNFHPKNEAQQHYLSTLRESTVTLCSGPAGTSKTFIAIYVALESLLNQSTSKIVLTRPIVPTEDLGYLPGDMNEKIHPYLMPLFDAVEIHVGPTKARELLDERIELLPLAYMRGRTLRNAVMILDEAQNSTRDQMKMFLTRMGECSKMFINGDVTQNDLPKHVESGLSWAIERLTGTDPEIGVVTFGSSHIVRHPLIGKMLAHLEGSERRAVHPKVYPALLGKTA